MTKLDVNGSCLCGAVTFHTAAPSKWCAHCHCTMCQRAHGAAFVTFVGYEEKDVTIEGTENLKWHHSSELGQRGFCTECGTTLFFRSSKWPGELHVTRANIAGDIDRVPEGHAHYDTHVGWVTLADDLPRS